MPRIPTASAIAAKFGIVELGAEVQKAGRLLLELDEAESAIVEDDHFHRQTELLAS